MAKLEDLVFQNTYASLGDHFYSKVLPTPLASSGSLVAFNPDAAALIGLDLSEAKRPEFLDYFGGRRLFLGSDPLAMVYAGHQFGVRVPRLGDGRAILLGEVKGADVEGRPMRFDLHLKGSGRTPYSRHGDGMAVLRSSIREYLCGEAMHGLRIPTTRTLCIVGSDEPVMRETVETRAMITRLAPTHIRFGSFEYFYSQLPLQAKSDSGIEQSDLTKLADYTIAEHFPEIQKEFSKGPELYAAWFKEVCKSTARLIAKWHSVGFAHGVLNTDNMSILGLTLDYGPYGFLEEFNPALICNHSDEGGRYAFSEQPSIGLWNLNVLAQSLLPLMTEDYAISGLQSYEPTFYEELTSLMRAKLGFREPRSGDEHLYSELFQVMQAGHADHTRFFRALSNGTQSAVMELSEETRSQPEWTAWVAKYHARLDLENDAHRKERMDQANPKFILRNYLAQNAIEAAQAGRFEEIDKLLNILKDPFHEHPEFEDYAKAAPEWGMGLIVSCSS